MTDPAKGVLAMVLACTVWGLSPLYYAQLKHVPPFEVLCYRGLWSLAFFAIILAMQRRLSLVGQALIQPRVFWRIVAAALMISTNWLGFIYAISTSQGMEASLGYYIFPLVAVSLGALTFSERLRPAQWTAVGLVGLAVAVLTYGLGVAPWIALVLAATFAAYSVLKKRLVLGPVVSVTAEVAVLAPIAVGWLVFAGTQGQGDWQTHVLLAVSGPLTATPLILFSYAARRIRLSTVGLVQYLNPTLQFACAVLVFGEPFTPWHGAAFSIIWAALLIYSVSAIRQDRASRRVASTVATSSANVT